MILYLLAKKLGFAEQMFKNITVNGEEPLIEDVLREVNRGTWTIGYTGQSPERLKLQAKNRQTFNTTTLRAEGGPCDGDYYGTAVNRAARIMSVAHGGAWSAESTPSGYLPGYNEHNIESNYCKRKLLITMGILK